MTYKNTKSPAREKAQTYKAIRALKEANASQHRLIKKLAARNTALEGVVEALMPYYQKDMENFGLELASLYPLATNLPIRVLQALKKLEEV